MAVGGIIMQGIQMVHEKEQNKLDKQNLDAQTAIDKQENAMRQQRERVRMIREQRIRQAQVQARAGAAGVGGATTLPAQVSGSLASQGAANLSFLDTLNAMTNERLRINEHTANRKYNSAQYGTLGFAFG